MAGPEEQDRVETTVSDAGRGSRTGLDAAIPQARRPTGEAHIRRLAVHLGEPEPLCRVRDEEDLRLLWHAVTPKPTKEKQLMRLDGGGGPGVVRRLAQRVTAGRGPSDRLCDRRYDEPDSAEGIRRARRARPTGSDVRTAGGGKAAYSCDSSFHLRNSRIRCQAGRKYPHGLQSNDFDPASTRRNAIDFRSITI